MIDLVLYSACGLPLKALGLLNEIFIQKAYGYPLISFAPVHPASSYGASFSGYTAARATFYHRIIHYSRHGYGG